VSGVVVDMLAIYHKYSRQQYERLSAATDLCRSIGFPSLEAKCLHTMNQYAKARRTETVALKKIANRLGDKAWTRERATASKGYDASKAREIFRRFPRIELVVISRDSLVRDGFGTSRTSQEHANILHYHKSTGGPYGRSVRETFVSSGDN
jgi:hypothetical protein